MNKDIKLRDEIIFGKYEPELYSSGTRRFKNLSKDTIKMLVDNDFIDLEMQFNDCPSMGTLVSFIENHPNFKLSGTAVSLDRSDYRVDFDEIKCITNITPQDMIDFRKLGRKADDFICTEIECYAWWD